jgi:hypothetical protein
VVAASLSSTASTAGTTGAAHLLCLLLRLLDNVYYFVGDTQVFDLSISDISGISKPEPFF